MHKDVIMDGIVATYLGKIVSKNNFRVFIYAPNGQCKLVESWEEYQKHMESGLWFASIEEAVIPREASAEKVIKEDVKAEKEPVLEEFSEDSLGFKEKKDDEFLPKKRK